MFYTFKLFSGVAAMFRTHLRYDIIMVRWMAPAAAAAVDFGAVKVCLEWSSHAVRKKLRQGNIVFKLMVTRSGPKRMMLLLQDIICTTHDVSGKMWYRMRRDRSRVGFSAMLTRCHEIQSPSVNLGQTHLQGFCCADSCHNFHDFICMAHAMKPHWGGVASDAFFTKCIWVSLQNSVNSECLAVTDADTPS